MRPLALLLTLTLGSCSVVLAKDPYTPGFPECVDGVAGYWQPYIKRNSETNALHVWIAVTTRDVLDPATVICWLPMEGFIQTMSPERMKEHKNPEQPVHYAPKEQAALTPLQTLRNIRWTTR